MVRFSLENDNDHDQHGSGDHDDMDWAPTTDYTTRNHDNDDAFDDAGEARLVPYCATGNGQSMRRSSIGRGRDRVLNGHHNGYGGLEPPGTYAAETDETGEAAESNGYHGSDGLGEFNDINTSGINGLLGFFNQHLQQQQRHQQLLWEEEQLLARKRRRRRMLSMISFILIVSFLLNRYAPPPPPIYTSDTIGAIHPTAKHVEPGISLNNNEVLGSDTFYNLDEETNQEQHTHQKSKVSPSKVLTQHSTWYDYTQHIFSIIYPPICHAVTYAASVAYYVIYHVTKYAADEIGFLVRQGWNTTWKRMQSMWQGNFAVCPISPLGDGMWSCWKKEILVLLGFSGGAQNVTPIHNNDIGNEPSSNNSKNSHQVHNNHPKFQMEKLQSCPMNLPAARQRIKSVPRGARGGNHQPTSTSLEGWSTEDFLQMPNGNIVETGFGRLSPKSSQIMKPMQPLNSQSMAIHLLAQGLDDWGSQLVEVAPLSLVTRMARVDLMDWSRSSRWNSVNDRNDLGRDENDDTHTASEWILPPATGFLLVGSEGVGKRHLAHRMAHLLFGHCQNGMKDLKDLDSFNNPKRGGESAYLDPAGTIHLDEPKQNHKHQLENFEEKSIQMLEGVLEINADEYELETIMEKNVNENMDNNHPVKELILNHLHRRQGLGSIIILHHIEFLPPSVLTELSDLFEGKSDNLWRTGISTEGAAFVFTTKQWGTKSIFRQIQLREGLNELRRESLVSAIKKEAVFARHVPIIAPVLPFQKEDLTTLFQQQFDLINTACQGSHWKELKVSNTAYDYFTGIDHVEYFDLFSHGAYQHKQQTYGNNDDAHLTFSISGGHALRGTLWKTLQSKLRGVQRRMHKIAFLDFDPVGEETVLSWCNDVNDRLNGGASHWESCEEEWRMALH